MAQRVRKAVLPVAGLGTRFLPATKAMPKEMLTVVDRPLIQYAIEECLAAGIDEFVFVTGRNKSALEDHFDAAYELEDTLVKRGKKPELKQTQEATIRPGNAIFTRQQRPLGLGHAVWCARHWIGREPFADLHRPARCGPREDRWQCRGGDGRAARADRELRHRRG
jgi:UTP--glucose-1-phosphate uridylyltransferase